MSDKLSSIGESSSLSSSGSPSLMNFFMSSDLRARFFFFFFFLSFFAFFAFRLGLSFSSSELCFFLRFLPVPLVDGSGLNLGLRDSALAAVGPTWVWADVRGCLGCSCPRCPCGPDLGCRALGRPDYAPGPFDDWSRPFARRQF